MAQFVRAKFSDPGPISVELWRTVDGEIIGNVRRRREGATDTHVSPDMRACAAVRSAEIEANAIGSDVLVIDPNGLWSDHWGALRPARN